MIRIAICDDTAADRESVLSYTKSYFEKRGIDAKIDTYQGAAALLESEPCHDLYLLDVLMPGMGGMEAAARLKKKLERPVIVFITSSLEAAVEGYSVNAAGFILKPVQQQNYDTTLSRVISERLKEAAAAISVVSNRVPVMLQLSRVVSFENRLHRVYVTMADGGMLTIHQKLQELEDLLAEHPQFLRCHQSYIVNLNHVERLENSCFYTHDRQVIPVSRNFYKQSKHAYYRHLLK